MPKNSPGAVARYNLPTNKPSPTGTGLSSIAEMVSGWGVATGKVLAPATVCSLPRIRKVTAPGTDASARHDALARGLLARLRSVFADGELQSFKQSLAEFSAVALDLVAQHGAHGVDVGFDNFEIGIVLTAWGLRDFVERFSEDRD